MSVEKDAYDEAKLIGALKDAGFGGSIQKNGAAPSPSGENQTQPGKPISKVQSGSSGQVSYSNRAFGEHVQVSAQLDRDVLRPGDAFRLAVVFQIDKGWHIYGNPVGPGVGQQTVISARSSGGFQFEDSRFAPAEKTDQDFGEAGRTWVWQHTGRTIHYITGQVPETVSPGEYEWIIEASAQVCAPTACLPGKASVRLPIKVAPRGAPSDQPAVGAPANKDLFAGFAAAKVPPAATDQ